MADRTRALAQELRRQIEDAVEDTYRRSLQRLVPGARVLGVRVPRLRLMAAALAKRADAPGAEELCGLMDQVSRDGWREEILVLTFALGRNQKTLALMGWPRLEAWLPAIDNWETCDQLATNVAAPLVAASPALWPRLEGLTASARSWDRRFAVATVVGLNQRGRRHPAQALKVLAKVVREEDPIVQKAIGWALREVSQVDAAATFAFLSKQKAALGSRVLREAAEKLPAAQRRALGV
jgi:3-methyladenine DNA glycosylase AlkD